MEEEVLTTREREICKREGERLDCFQEPGGDLSAVPLANFLWVGDCFNHFNFRFTILSIIIRRN